MDKNQLKAEGLAFGRNLQRAHKIVLLYSPDHGAAQDSLQQAYSLLTALLKLNPQFTFGFYNQRVLLNDLLTSDSNLAPLQADFAKRSIAAVTFQVGVTFREFKRCLGLLVTKPQLIEASGGIAAFLRKNPVEGLRILPEEDTVRGMDLQSYLAAQAIFETQPGRKSASLDMLVQAAGMEITQSFSGTPAEVLDLASKAAQAAWSDPQKNPSDVVQSLARLLEELSPDYLISALPSEKQGRYRGRASPEIAVELAEDMAVEWAGKRLAASPGTAGAARSASEQEVARVLARTLKTTQVAQRLLQKVGALVNQNQLPEEVVQRIQGELLWSSLTTEERHARLLEMKDFTESEFRHLVEHVEEMGRAGNVEKATQVSDRFLAWLGSCSGEVRATGLSWLPELLRALSGLDTLAFVRTVAERLCAELLEEPIADWKCHHVLANSLASAAQCAALFEDFETALKIGLDLERFQKRDSAQHADCCGASLKNLLDPRSVERLVALSLQKHSDAAMGRTLASLVRLAAAQTAEVVLQLLEEETAATNRARLIRLAGQLGSSGLEAGRKRLADKRWYVVRNACNILGALGDPELAAQLGPALRHPDVRVQQAAVAAIAKSKVSGRCEVLAEALPYLQPHSQEAVLNELFLAKDPATILPLGDFVLLASGSKAGIRERAVQVLATIPDPRTVEALSRILSDTGQPLLLRRVALNALRSSSVPLAQQRLVEFARRAPADSLAEECRVASTAKTS